MISWRCKLPCGWTQIEASAPGRFVLVGEYGDLDDHNAIAVAIDRRLRVTIRPHKDKLVRLNLKDFDHVREWPTTLPLFSMTKLVANYADTLVYTKAIQQSLKPLLNQKYYKTSLNIKHSKDTAQNACDNNDINDSPTSNQPKKSSPAGTTLSPQATRTHMQQQQQQNQQQVFGVGYDEQRSSDKKQATNTTGAKQQDEIEPPLFYEVQKSGHREIDPIAQADATVIAFFILYLALGDSFAGSQRPSLDVEIESEIPMCRGLGSSTALGVALCGALMKVFRISAEPTVTVDWAHSVDKYFHTEATSLHSSVSVNGGYIYYQKDKVKSFGVPHTSPPKVMLIDSGIRRDPKQVVGIIVKKLERKIDLISAALNQLSDLASRIWRSMNDQQFKTASIHQSLATAQGTLNNLGLDHKQIERLSTMAQRLGLVVKQSQAGETVFLLYEELDEKVAEFVCNLAFAGFKFDHHEICFKGLSIKVQSLEVDLNTSEHTER